MRYGMHKPLKSNLMPQNSGAPGTLSGTGERPISYLGKLKNITIGR